jgi:hypothetical protein
MTPNLLYDERAVAVNWAYRPRRYVENKLSKRGRSWNAVETLGKEGDLLVKKRARREPRVRRIEYAEWCRESSDREMPEGEITIVPEMTGDSQYFVGGEMIGRQFRCARKAQYFAFLLIEILVHNGTRSLSRPGQYNSERGLIKPKKSIIEVCDNGSGRRHI